MYNSYILPGIVDAAVMHKQAERRCNDKFNPEMTIIHYHSYDYQRPNLKGCYYEQNCNEKCVVYEPGYRLRSVGEPRVKEEEDGN